MSHEINYESVANKLAGQLATAQLNNAALSDLAEQLSEKLAQTQQENAQLRASASDVNTATEGPDA